jgi:hypothetical protein
LKQLIEDVKQLKNLSYDYKMDVEFPNGDKDHLQGMTYLNTDDKFYYNDCPAFTMIYSDKWFYKADHKNKTLTVIDLEKEENKKVKSGREKEIFKNGALNTFLDSFLMKRAIVKNFKQEGDTYDIQLGFKGSTNVKMLRVVYNNVNGLLISCEMLISEPWQKTANTIRSMQLKVKYDNFKKVVDKSMFSEAVFFSCDHRKLELKKYDNYKLTKKI